MKHLLRILRDPDPAGANPEGGSPADPTKANSYSATIPNVDDPQPKPFNLPEGVDFDQLVPEDYRDKPYLKDVMEKKDVKAIFDKLDNAQKLIGQRPEGIPGPEAAPEEWDKFYKMMGRPEEANAYEFSYEELPEEIKSLRNEEFEGTVKKLMYDAGLTAEQAKKLQTGYDKLMVETLEKSGALAQQRDVDFDKLASDTFGKDKVDTVLASSKKMLEQFVPENLKEHVANLSNENLVVLASVLDGVRQKYIGEDGLSNSSPAGGATDVGDLRAQGRELMASEAYTNPRHIEHQKVKAEVENLYKRIGNLITSNQK